MVRSMKMTGWRSLVATVALCLLAVRPCLAGGEVLRLRDRTAIDFDRMIAEVKGASIIFVGETHATPSHHELQLRVIRALHKNGVPLAIALEMFAAENQHELDRWVVGMTDEQSFVRQYERNWKIPWPLYRDIFIYARDNRIPLIGLNVPTAIVQKVARSGFAALTPEERRLLPPDITCSVDAVYMAFIRKAFAGHFGSEKNLLHFCEAQMVWTKSMAQRIVSLLRDYPRQTVIVLTGVGHAMKRGIPDEIREKSGFSSQVLLPEDPGFNTALMTTDDVDYLLSVQ